MTDTPTDTTAATDAVASVPEATTPEAPSRPAGSARKAPAKAAAKEKGTTRRGTKKAGTPAPAKTAKAGPSPVLAPTPAPGVEMIPLGDLDLSPLNPRQEGADPDALDRLADNIRTVGLIHALAGLPGPDGRVGIVAGGRRLRAIRVIATQEPSRFEVVPVKLAPDEETARLWAASENAAREPLHPADEVRQFGALRDRGLAVPQIATAFAATEAHVRRRLTLAGLPAMVLDALRAGEISLDHAAAFTVAQDEGRMREALAHVRGGEGHVSAAHLRGILAPRVPTLTDRRAALVGLDAYEEAGGAVTRDLFSEAVYLHDEAILDRVFEERLAAEAEQVRSEEGWLWAEAMPAAQWIGWHEIEGRGLTPTYPEAGELTPEEWEAFEDLTAAAEDGALDEDARARLGALEAASRDSFTDAQRAVAGALVHVGLSGRPGWKSSALPPHSAALTSDLDAIRTGAVQAALLDHPNLLLDFLAFGFSPASGAYGRALDFHPGRPLARLGVADGFTADPRLRDRPGDGQEGEAKPLSYLTDEQRAEAFAAFRDKPREVRMAALAQGLARLMPGRDQAGAPLFDAVAAMAGAQVRAVWRPTAAGYFGRVTAGRLDAIMADLLEAGPGDDRLRTFRAMRKGEKAAVLEALFADQEKSALWRVTPEQAERIARWVPEPVRTPRSEEHPEPGPALHDVAATADGTREDAGDGAVPDEEPGEAVPATLH